MLNKIIEKMKKDKMKAVTIIAAVIVFIVGIIVTAVNTGDSYAVSSSDYICDNNYVMYDDVDGFYCCHEDFEFIDNTNKCEKTYSGNLSNAEVDCDYYDGTITTDRVNLIHICTVDAIDARKRKEYIISLDPNGTVWSEDPSGGARKITVVEGNNFSFPSLSRTGYKLEGWSMNSNGSGTIYKVGSSYVPTVNATYYAVWTETTFKISLDPNGAVWSEDPSGGARVYDVKFGNSFKFPSLSRTGYELVGWSLNKDGSGTIYNVGNSYVPTIDATYYAVWKETTLKISLDPNGTVWPDIPSGSSRVYDVKFGNSFKFPSLSRTGYELEGWSLNKDGSGTIYKVGSSYVPTVDNTYYAIWEVVIDTPTNPDGEDDTPTNPDDGDDTPTNPDGGDDTPTNPDGGDDTPTNPDGGDDTPTNPDGGDDIPTNPDDGDDTPTNPGDGNDNPIEPDEDNSKVDEEIDENKQTGNILIYTVWIIGAGALGYVVYYFMKRRNNI